jgi:small-conductance mechanosensitive channel
MREAAARTPRPTPELEDLQAEKDYMEEAVAADQRLMAQLTRQAAEATGDRKDALGDQLEVAKAQLELDQDELADAADNLEKAGGDPQARVRRLRVAHDAVQNESRAAVPEDARFKPGSLVGRIREWTAQRTKLARLEQAQQDEQQKVQELRKRKEAADDEVQKQWDDRENARKQAAGFVKRGKAADPGSSRVEAKAAIVSLKRFTDAQRSVVSLGKRLQDEEDLSEVYGSWAGLAWAYKQVALHRVLGSVLWILGTLLAVFLVGRLARRRSGTAPGETRRPGLAGSVVTLAAQVAGVLVIVFVILGVPAQATTILGLAGAGLTVALKDFIVAFFGWFVLMGRNGIHVGDWVEIKGVGGEVVEIGLLRTVLLETGNWSDAGHPTGRRVTFVNSFAIEGHYFNFSTSGQWMWDELNVLVPPGQDPYPVIDGIQKLVAQETEANAKLAEEEWKHTTTRYRVQAFSAQPGINVRPTSNGIEVRVRYITRAYQRHEVRRGLYQAVVELMHGKRPEDVAPTEA